MIRPTVQTTPLAALIVALLLGKTLTAFGQAAVPTRDLTTAAIAQRTTPATVTIITFGRSGDTLGLGSGFFVSPSGAIITNWHVIRDAYDAVVILADGTELKPVLFLGADKRADIALIEVPQGTYPIVPLANDVPPIGTRVVVIGSPLGLSATVSEGIISARRTVEGRELVQVTAALSPGSSGGPVVNAQGSVIAIATASLEAGQALNFGVPVGYAKQLLRMTARARQLASATEWRSMRAAAEVGTVVVGVYEGSVANATLPDWPGSLRIEFTGWTPSAHGYLTIGPPLAGSGPVTAGWLGDSIAMMTISETADTILWFAPYRPTLLKGFYHIVGGAWKGQHGIWEVSLKSGSPIPLRQRLK